jgi:hypothetical protein
MPFALTGLEMRTAWNQVFQAVFAYLLRTDPTGFEPAISALTGPHVRPLHHGSNTNAREMIPEPRTFVNHVLILHRYLKRQQRMIDFVASDPRMRHRAETPEVCAGTDQLHALLQHALRHYFATDFHS